MITTRRRGQMSDVQDLAWEALIEAGRAYLRRGATPGGPPDAEPAARRAYFAALYRACRENSFEGILRAAEAFADLGDREVVEECLGLVALQAEGEQSSRPMFRDDPRVRVIENRRQGHALLRRGETVTPIELSTG